MVEDNAGDRWLYSELLRERGHVVTSCASGEEAWEEFKRGVHPLVVLDLLMPGIGGVELCRRIRSHPRGREPVLLAVTALDDPEALDAFLEAGADDFVPKPVPPRHFAARMAIAERRIRDRFERRGTQAELDFKTWELEQLFRNLPDVFFSVDVTTGRLIQISPAAETLFGVEHDAFTTHPDLWRRYLLPVEDDVDPWLVMRDEPKGDRFLREYRITRSDGSAAWVRATVSMDEDPRSGHIRADGFVADVTEERRASRILAERNRELAALYRVSEVTQTSATPGEAYADILFEIARVMGVPTVLLEQVDRSADRLVTLAAWGRPFDPSSLPETPIHQSPAGSTVQTGRPSVFPDLRTARGTIHDQILRLEPRFWASLPLSAAGAVYGVLSLVDTAPREVDERWTQLAVSLAAAVAAYMERMDSEEALRESEARHRALAQQLKQANQELEAFAYSVSHDLRAPLRTMQGFAHALLQNYGDEMPEEARDYARRIIVSGRQSERLISDLLAYSRLSFEKLDMKPVDLGAVLGQSLEQIQAYVHESGAQVDVSRDLPTVLGSQTALVQVVSNLLSNAVKFSAPGTTPVVRVFAEERDDVVRLWVEDNGVGVPEGQEDRIFGVFERLDQGGERPGTGIGLAVVRRGMERIGGRCGVERRPEGGSAFWIEAPQDRRQARRPWTRRPRGA